MANTSPVNDLEEEFLRKYLGGAAYSADAFNRASNESRKKSGQSLYLVFDGFLREKYSMVSEADLSDFKARFAYVRIENNVAHETTQPERALSPFTRGKNLARLGVVQDGELRSDNGVVLARRVAQFRVFHLYETQVLFYGVVAELICQMPEEFRRSGKHFYYTLSPSVKIEERYEAHLATIELFERCQPSRAAAAAAEESSRAPEAPQPKKEVAETPAGAGTSSGAAALPGFLATKFADSATGKSYEDEPAPSESETCGVCLDKKKQLAIQECGHRLCFGCARRLSDRPGTAFLCPLCRAQVQKELIRVF
jgi:hypothetical protein